jgi:hypothetical protein
MFGLDALSTRIAVGKSIGAIIGITAFFFIPVYMPDASATLQWGVMFWYITFGAVIGLFGIYTMIPVLNIPMPWWFRGAYIGAWLNFVIALIAYDSLSQLMVAIFGADGIMTSPFWVVLEGAMIGFFIDLVATRYGGDGAAMVQG